MRSADEACYAAKDAGRNRMQEYELGDARMMRRRGVMEWVTQLDKAMDDGRLILNCQRIAPVQVASNGSRSHYEILLTMRDELGDLMPPSEFILAAETYNRVTMVDRWVVENVLTWMADHRNSLDSFGGFAINVSGHSVNDESFADFVLEQFSRMQAPTSKVCFEITETAAIANLDNARDFMNRMKIIGCRFSLDDFGTGLSSYSYLRNLPVDYVKIDGVFVKELEQRTPSDYAVVRSINEIGHYLGKKTIAEFVENDAILTQLREIGVDYAQGYGIEKPGLALEPATELKRQLRAQAQELEQRLLRMQPVAGFCPHHRSRIVQHVVADFFAAMCRQAMHEHRVAFGEIQQLSVHLIAGETLAAFGSPRLRGPSTTTRRSPRDRRRERLPAAYRPSSRRWCSANSSAAGSNPLGHAICSSKPNWRDASMYELHMLYPSPTNATVRPGSVRDVRRTFVRRRATDTDANARSSR